MALSIALGSDEPEDPDDRVNLGRLWDQLSGFRTRYGVPISPKNDRLHDRVLTRKAQLAHVEEQLEELLAEQRRLRQEIAGYEKGIALSLRSEINHLRDKFGEAWSPVAVQGYRVWAVKGDRLHGSVRPWERPHFKARCERHNGTQREVPHSDGGCGPPGCGVYAAKDPAWLRVMRPGPNFALGLVDMEGKVVEHERGYRGAEVTVVALGVVVAGRLLMTDSAGVIEAVFADPRRAVLDWGSMRRGEVWDEIVAYLRERERRTWTLESSSE